MYGEVWGLWGVWSVSESELIEHLHCRILQCFGAYITRPIIKTQSKSHNPQISNKWEANPDYSAKNSAGDFDLRLRGLASLTAFPFPFEAISLSCVVWFAWWCGTLWVLVWRVDLNCTLYWTVLIDTQDLVNLTWSCHNSDTTKTRIKIHGIYLFFYLI